MDTSQTDNFIQALDAALSSLDGLCHQLATYEFELSALELPRAQVESARTAIQQFKDRFYRAAAEAAAKATQPSDVPVETPITGRDRPPFALDSTYAPSKLSESQQRWNEHVLKALTSPRLEPNARSVMTSSTSEIVGFTGRDYVIALAVALNTTGNITYLTEIVNVMQALKNRKNFSIDTDKDKAFIASMFALVAYLCRINSAAGEAIAEAGNYWYGRLLELCRNGIPSDDLTHSFVASIETSWYLNLMTNEERYKVEAEKRRDDFLKGVTYTEDGRALWEHRPIFARNKPGNSIQRTTYARYVVGSVVMLDRLGFPTIPLDKLAKTVLGVVRADKTLALFLDGTQNENANKITLSNWALVTPYDSSGELARRLSANVKANQVQVAIGLLQL